MGGNLIRSEKRYAMYKRDKELLRIFLITKDRSFLSMTRILSPVLDDKGTKKKE